jgi:HlyD family secretion protein
MALSRRRKIIIGISAVVLLAAIILISVFATRKDVPEVNTVKVEKRRELKSTVTASGEVRPIQYINLTSEVQGRIVDIYVKEGDVVTKGQPLVKLDPTQLESSKDAQLAALQSAQSEVQVSGSQISAAKNQLAQSQQSLVASESAVDTAIQQVNSAREAVSTAQQNVAQARQQVVTAQTEVDRTQVDLNTAQRELRRATELLESGVISRQEYDQTKDRVDQAEVALRNARARLEAQKIAVREAEGRVKEAQTQVNVAQTRVNEARARVKQQQAALTDANRGVTTAELNYRSSQSRADQQAALLRGSSSQRDKTLQVAPLNGIVAEIPSKLGTFATAGLSTTALMTIADMSSVNVEVKVDETEIDKVAVGQPAKIKVDALGEKELTGEVTQKTPLALGKSQTTGGLSTNINVQEAKEFRVVIQLKDLADDVRESLRPGMSATATITTQTAKEVLTVPLQAIVNKLPNSSPTPAGENNNNTANPSEKPKPIEGVYILESGKAKFVEITKGITGESDIEITSGLSEGMEVITGPSRILKTLKEGDVVKKQVKKEGNDNANK